jgi:hypothetical protein
MKNKFYIFNLLLSGLVLFSILFQFVHSYEHLVKQMSEKHCIHKANKNESNITHKHSGFDHCYICQFAFSPFKLSETYLFQIKKLEFSSNYRFFYAKEISILYKGSLFALRAPPRF